MKQLLDKMNQQINFLLRILSQYIGKKLIEAEKSIRIFVNPAYFEFKDYNSSRHGNVKSYGVKLARSISFTLSVGVLSHLHHISRCGFHRIRYRQDKKRRKYNVEEKIDFISAENVTFIFYLIG